MSNRAHDVIIAGGSVAGAALGWALAGQGARVLLVEPEPSFRDRVRGESIHPWGVVEAERLGLLPELDAARPRRARYWSTYVGGVRVDQRDLPQTTPGRQSGLNVHHPELQVALLSAAARAGCEVLRGARVTRLWPGAEPAAELSSGQRRRAQLLVLADGRSSALRAQLELVTRAQRSPLWISGVLLDAPRPEDETELFWPAELGAMAMIVPLSAARARLYVAQPEGERYSGESSFGALLARAAQLGVPHALLERARLAGPLATFETALTQLEPASLPRGLVAVGDAAGTVDPAFGCGLSMALRDARCLRDRLAAARDLPLGAAEFAHERSAYHAALSRLEDWLRRILYRVGADPDPIRAAALTRLESRPLDLIGLGPDAPSDAATEAQLFAPA